RPLPPTLFPYTTLFRSESMDVNGTPKILPRDVLLGMDLQSKDWFLDPEIMIKAHTLGLRIIEFNAFARMRGSGVSHVRVGTCWRSEEHTSELQSPDHLV